MNRFKFFTPLLTYLLPIFLAFALAACGGGGGDSPPPADTAINTAIAPSITIQPAALSVVTGGKASFSVTAAGTAPFSYQWQQDGKDIAGETSRSYTIDSASVAQSGAISVVVSNGAGSVTSNTATLGVTDKPIPPSIATPPAALSVLAGAPASFSVTAAGTSPFLYQWKKNGADIADATSPTYNTPATAIGDNGTAYSVVVTNSAGHVTSNAATLTVSATAVPPSIATQPAAQSVVSGGIVSFTVTAAGTAPFGYQWNKNGTDISGATSSSYTTPATVIGDNNAVFRVVVSNSALPAGVTSNDATLTVSAVAAAIDTQPAAQMVTAGQTATFSVTASGTAPFTYQWKKNGVNVTGGIGATSNTYTTPAMSYAGNGAMYSVVVSNSAGSVTSSTATLTVNKTSTLQSYGYVANASDGLYDKTECVQDNNTGLIWEGKTASPATTRLGTSTYTNFDSTDSAQKLSEGSFVNPTQTEIGAITNSIGYKNSVNTSALCGYTDWRLPTNEELQGILASSGNPRIDTTWFPNTQAVAYWSSSPYVGYSYYAWYVDFSYSFGGSGDYRDVNGVHVRLVR